MIFTDNFLENKNQTFEVGTIFKCKNGINYIVEKIEQDPIIKTEKIIVSVLGQNMVQLEFPFMKNL